MASTPSYPHIKAATTTRQAENLALHVDDNPVIVQANRQKLIQSLELLATPVWLNQIHSNQIISLNQLPTSPPTADAALTATCVNEFVPF